MLFIRGKALHVDLYQVLSDIRGQTKGEAFRNIRPLKNDIFVTCINKEAHGGDEVIPSLSISKKSGYGHCFGCNKTYDLATIVAHGLGLNNSSEGYLWLVRHYRVGVGRKQREKEIVVFESQRKQKIYLSDEEATKYLALEHPYAYQRKLTAEVLDLFEVGYDPEVNALTIPVRNERAKLAYLIRAMVTSKDREFGKYREPIGADKNLLFGLDKIMSVKEKVDVVFLVEGPIDTMYMWVAGKYAVGQLGSSLRSGQFKQYIRNLRKPVALLYDNPALEPKVEQQLVRTYEMLRTKVPVFLGLYPRDDAKDPNTLSIEEIQNIRLEEL